MGRGAGDANAGVVLLRAIDVIWELVIDNYVVELRGRLIILRRPVQPAIGADVSAAIIGVDEPLGIGWINPESVIVAVRRRKLREGLAAVDGAIRACIKDVNDIRIFRIRKHMRVVPGALAEAMIVVDQPPVLATIVGAIQPAFVCFDQGVNAIGLR